MGRPQAASLGVDIGGTKLLGLALDAGNQVVAEARAPTPSSRGALVEAVASVLAELLTQLAPPGPAGLPAGLGAPGLVDRRGVLHFSPNLAGVAAAVDLAREVGDRVEGLRLAVENDATCACAGEAALGEGAGRRQLVMVTLGTGIGGGLVVDGQLVVGAHGFAGEVGHMVVDPSGPPCPCGQRGCWERFASGTGLGRLGREAAQAGRAPSLVELAGGDPEAVRGEHVTQAARAGAPDALAVMESFAWWLGLGLANLAGLVDPEVMVVGGGLVEAGDCLLEPTRRALARLLPASHLRPAIPVLAARLGERAGAVGAALLARRRLGEAGG